MRPYISISEVYADSWALCLNINFSYYSFDVEF